MVTYRRASLVSFLKTKVSIKTEIMLYIIILLTGVMPYFFER